MAALEPDGSARPVWAALKYGFQCRCPRCGKGRLFWAYLKVNDRCDHCGLEFFHHRADDAPPYVTIVIIGHLIVGSMLMVEEFAPNAPIWLHIAIWPTLATLLSLWLLPRIKGALIGLQWALRMHGFGDGTTE
jgi:uncharacterized protein (DUF983 family)